MRQNDNKSQTASAPETRKYKTCPTCGCELYMNDDRPCKWQGEQRTIPAEKPTEWSLDTETHTAFSGKRFRGNAITCNGKLIGKLVGFSEENAKLIVASVNHAAQLAEALRDILQWFAEPYDPSPKSLPQAKATLAAYEATRQ